ncbi:AraC family transcriptional regulator [Calothrix sp. NIES-4071]|nr:AraC family transcriptional regulator [Calothrix sp. NIES-4071]BAZ57799.1 AraC family transcriptional regulator [Calothrix sp. NIES-4105]
MGGDLVVLPSSLRHVLRDNPESQLTDFDSLVASIDERPEVLLSGGEGLPTTVIYGRFKFETLRENPLLLALPPLLIVKGEEGRTVEWLDTTLQFMASEMATTRPGAQTVINHLAGILFVQAVRAYIASTDCSSNRCWLGALTDSHIGAALNLIHRHPDRAWTVEELAEQVSLSRTTFFVKFRELVGESPNKYLTRWRMHRASQILRSKRMTLSEVASLVGYESEVAFGKAFKQWMGQSPGAYRQTNSSLLISPST